MHLLATIYLILNLGSCSNLRSKDYSNLKIFQHEINVLIYEGFNHNLEFMLELKLEMLSYLGK